VRGAFTNQSIIAVLFFAVPLSFQSEALRRDAMVFLISIECRLLSFQRIFQAANAT